MDTTLQQLLLRLVALAAVASVHGWALAAAAGALGDRGPQYDGRRTLNPFAHLDVVGGICLVAFGFGWIKPVALDRSALRWGGAGQVAVALAGLAAVIALAVAAEVLRRPLIQAASGNLPLYGIAVLEVLATQALAFVLINFVPLPPFTGALFLGAAVPRLEPAVARYWLVFVAVAAVFVASGLADRLFLPVYRPLARWLLGA